MQTNELTGAALDWAVALIEFPEPDYEDADRLVYVRGDDEFHFSPSTAWAQGGPIIEREQITLRFSENHWVAEWWADNSKMARSPAQRFRPNRFEVGPTPLVAAMRCYVASKLGDEIEVPDELTI